MILVLHSVNNCSNLDVNIWLWLSNENINSGSDEDIQYFNSFIFFQKFIIKLIINDSSDINNCNIKYINYFCIFKYIYIIN